MKATSPRVVYVTLLVLVLGFSVACSRSSAPSDAQITGEVQTKLSSNSNLQGKQIQVQSSNGVVTLSGVVSSDFERMSAANDAAQVDGVKTVVNNLEVAQDTMAQAPPPVMAEAQGASQPTSGRVVTPAKRPSQVQSAPRVREYNETPAMADASPSPAARTVTTLAEARLSSDAFCAAR